MEVNARSLRGWLLTSMIAASYAANAADDTMTRAARQGLIDGISAPFQALGIVAQPEWITVAPRPKEECLAASAGIIDAAYVRCRNGYQQQVQRTVDGKSHVIAERPIPR